MAKHATHLHKRIDVCNNYIHTSVRYTTQNIYAVFNTSLDIYLFIFFIYVCIIFGLPKQNGVVIKRLSILNITDINNEADKQKKTVRKTGTSDE